MNTDNLAIDIARQCQSCLTQQVTCKSKNLSPEQMRGYIRAYANCTLESVINQREDFRNLNSTQISKVKFQAKENLIEMIVRDLQCTPPTVVADFAAAA